MTPQRRKELECGPGPQRLTADEIEQGYHFCPEWDFMVIGPGDSEMDACTCNLRIPDPVSISAALREGE